MELFEDRICGGSPFEGLAVDVVRRNEVPLFIAQHQLSLWSASSHSGISVLKIPYWHARLLGVLHFGLESANPIFLLFIYFVKEYHCYYEAVLIKKF